MYVGVISQGRVVVGFGLVVEGPPQGREERGRGRLVGDLFLRFPQVVDLEGTVGHSLRRVPQPLPVTLPDFNFSLRSVPLGPLTREDS